MRVIDADKLMQLLAILAVRNPQSAPGLKHALQVVNDLSPMELHEAVKKALDAANASG